MWGDDFARAIGGTLNFLFWWFFITSAISVAGALAGVVYLAYWLLS